MGFFDRLNVGDLVDSYQSGGFFGLGATVLQQQTANPAGAVPVQTVVGAQQPPRNAAPIDEPSTQLAARPGILETITKQPVLMIGGVAAVAVVAYLLLRK